MGHLDKPFPGTKSHHEFTATALWHWLLTQSPSYKTGPRNKNEWLPELVMSLDAFVPISVYSCSDRGAGVSLRHYDRGPLHPPPPLPPDTHTHPRCWYPVQPLAASVSVALRAGSWRDGSFFLPADRNLTPGLVVWRETNYLSAALSCHLHW